LGFPDDEPVTERASCHLGLCIHSEADGSELHLGDRVMSIPALRRCGETSDEARLYLGQHSLEGDSRHMVTLVHDHVPVAGDEIVHFTSSNETLDHSDVERAVGLSLATANATSSWAHQARRHFRMSMRW
jgi:hypothetical protein